jgi:tripartite-type tricarboxylate transporter receptor subunit TctC
MRQCRSVQLILMLSALAALTGPEAQPFPNRPVRIINPFAQSAGVSVDC